MPYVIESGPEAPISQFGEDTVRVNGPLAWCEVRLGEPLITQRKTHAQCNTHAHHYGRGLIAQLFFVPVISVITAARQILIQFGETTQSRPARISVTY